MKTPNPETLKSFGPATLYWSGGMMGNWHRVEVRSVDVWFDSYAQYPRALYFRYVEKGCRKPSGFVQSPGEQSLLILDGHGHPQPPSMYGAPETLNTAGGEVTVSKSTYSSFDPRWAIDFDRMISEHIEKTDAKVLGDYRETARAFSE